MKHHGIPFKLFVCFVLAALVSPLIPNLTVNAATATLALTPSADAYVTNNSRSSNYGSSTSLRVDMSPTITSYLKFDVKGLNGAAIQSAKLRIYGNSTASAGFAVNAVSDTGWGEKTLTFDNAPAMGSTLGKSGGFSGGSWTTIDISSYVTKEGAYSLGLVDLSTTAINLASREAGANSPQLVLTLSTSSATAAPTQPAATQPPASTSTPTKTPAPTQPPAPTPTPSGQPVPLGVTGSWKLVFSDEFNGSSLDLGKWRPNWLGPSDTAITKPVNSNEQSCYDPAQVSVSGGSLKLTAVARTCSSWAYASGIVTTSGHFTFSHGFMEARLWLDGASSVKNWPAFWADGTGTWPTTGEIDVMEGLGGAPAWHYHWGSPSSPQQVGGTPPMSTRTGWHTFGADWESGVVRFYYDGKPVGQATQGVVDAQMFLILDYAVSAKIAGPIQVPSSLLVDYVRVWQH